MYLSLYFIDGTL